MKSIAFLTVILLCTLDSLAQNKDKMKNNNPLLCNPDSGICELPHHKNEGTHTLQIQNKPVKIIYFTDPICSSCWGIEPQLRKLKLEYGNDVEIEYHMGGLLPDWSYNSGGISKPSDVARHWDEVSAYYQMPIDGDVWLEDPLHSSFPPSIAFKAAQIQDKKKAVDFLRIIREMVFLEKKNITKWENIKVAATQAGLDVEQLKNDLDRKGKMLFEEDLKLAKSMRVRGFPSVFITNGKDKNEFIYGFKPYEKYVEGIAKADVNIKQSSYSKDWQSLFKYYPTLTVKEFEVLSGLSKEETIILLSQLANENKLSVLNTKNGALYKLKN